MDFDIAIVGAGVIGLACAAELSKQRSVIVLEQAERPGQATSSRNSGVIHAGLYYPSGSLKGALCVEGRKLLYQRCERFGIAHRKTGKLVVSTSQEEEARLAAILERGLEHGAGELSLISAKQVSSLEPNVHATAALWSPETGIVDVHELMYSYQKEASDADAILALRCKVLQLEPSSSGFELRVCDQGSGESSISARVVINAAGLHADRLAEQCGLDIDALGYRYHWCKGDYFALDSSLRGLVRHLVYPAPVHAGLGIHITFDLGGRLTLGPDTEYVSRLDYAVNENKREVFARAARRYLPEIRDDQLSPDYSGIRPKLQGPNDPVRDFVIEDAAQHGIPGLINLLGIESPGVTASEAVARYAARLAMCYWQ